MRILAELRRRFSPALQALADPGSSDRDASDGDASDWGASDWGASDLLAMIRPAQEARFGDYQANCAMPLGKQLGRPPREIATDLLASTSLEDLCDQTEVAGPGFINLRLRDDWLEDQLAVALTDSRLGVQPHAEARTYVIDYSAPNVAKPMHVGHIRSTVIGDAIYRTLRFVGHRVIGDNHLGDWGTQFGMIIYGFKHFRDESAYAAQPVAELARLYKLVSRLVDYQHSKSGLGGLEEAVAARRQAVTDFQQQPVGDAKGAEKKAAKQQRRLEAQAKEAAAELQATRTKVAEVEADPQLGPLLADHAGIAEAVLQETARLHAGDAENRRLWDQFLPQCRLEIQRIYERLGVRFDHEYGESFYHDRLASVVDGLAEKSLARESDGAMCVFLDGFDAPMIVRKKDGAFLYATTDLATIQFRMEEWRPEGILYVVDHRQAEHFEKLFAAARQWGYTDVDLRHVSFGTVLGEDGRPFKTRAGDTVGLEGLLDEAVEKAYGIVEMNDEQKKQGPELSVEERKRIAAVVGHGAIKYADLTHNRTSDYVFSYEKMLALQGNTATYMQYSYARVNGIFAKAGADAETVRASGRIRITCSEERALAVSLLRFADAIDESLEDFRPNQLTNYLYELTKTFFSFYEQCPVVKADADVRDSRLALCDLTGRTIKQGLQMLGIDVVERM